MALLDYMDKLVSGEVADRGRQRVYSTLESLQHGYADTQLAGQVARGKALAELASMDASTRIREIMAHPPNTGDTVKDQRALAALLLPYDMKSSMELSKQADTAQHEQNQDQVARIASEAAETKTAGDQLAAVSDQGTLDEWIYRHKDHIPVGMPTRFDAQSAPQFKQVADMLQGASQILNNELVQEQAKTQRFIQRKDQNDITRGAIQDDFTRQQTERARLENENIKAGRPPVPKDETAADRKAAKSDRTAYDSLTAVQDQIAKVRELAKAADFIAFGTLGKLVGRPLEYFKNSGGKHDTRTADFVQSVAELKNMYGRLFTRNRRLKIDAERDEQVIRGTSMWDNYDNTTSALDSLDARVQGMMDEVKPESVGAGASGDFGVTVTAPDGQKFGFNSQKDADAWKAKNGIR